MAISDAVCTAFRVLSMQTSSCSKEPKCPTVNEWIKKKKSDIDTQWTIILSKKRSKSCHMLQLG